MSLSRYFLQLSLVIASFFYVNNANAICEAGITPACFKVNSLHDLKSILEGVSCIRAEYRETRILRNLSKPLELQGQMFIARGLGVQIEQSEPESVATVLMQDRIVENGVRKNLAGMDLPQSLMALLFLHFEQLEQAFDITFKAVELGGYSLELKPKDLPAISIIRIDGECYPSHFILEFENGEKRSFQMSQLIFSPFKVSEQEILRFNR